MEGESALFVVVEFSVGLAGFASIVIALSARSQQGPRWRRYEITDFLVNALGSAFLALLPIVLHFIAVHPTTIWRLSSASLIAFGAGLSLGGLREARRLHEPLPPFYKRFANIAGGLIVLLQLSNSAGFPFEPQVGPFFIGLMWHLLFAAIGFGRILLRHFP